MTRIERGFAILLLLSDGSLIAATALARMEEMKITSLVVVDDGQSVRGIVHLHDLWGTEMV